MILSLGSIPVNSGVSSVEHGSLFDNEPIELLEEKGTAFMPTLNNFDFLVPTVNQSWLSLQPDYIVESKEFNKCTGILSTHS